MLGSVFIPERSERNYGIVGLVWTLNLRSYLHAGAFVFGRAQQRDSFNMLHRPDKVR